MAASKPNSLRTGCPGFPNIPENLDLDLESQVMLLLEEHKKDIINLLKKYRKNGSKVRKHYKGNTKII